MLNISQKWRLDGLLNSASADEFSKKWQDDLVLFLKELEGSQDLVKSILDFEKLSAGFRQFSSYANCLFSENVQNLEALALSSKAVELETLLQKAGSKLNKKLLEAENFDTILQDERIAPIAFSLSYRRQSAKEMMSVEKEELASDLALYGYHSWYELYKQAISKMRGTVDVKNVVGSFSCSELDNLLSNPDREVRKGAFIALENACKQDEALFAQALRSIIGFRLELYRHRGWKSPIHDALRSNYMQQATLDKMWDMVAKAAPKFVQFLDEKAKVFGLKMLSWYDFDAPYPGADTKISYKNASSMIVELFGKVNQDMETFAENCFRNEWIEAENRPGKAPGGFCTPFPISGQSRIYMSYADSVHNFLVLAHELGHAYHDHVCFELPELAQHYPSSVAETASTTAELIVLDGLIAQVKSKEEKKWLYYEKAHRSTMFFLNMQARFSFEQELFKELPKGYLDSATLCQMMTNAQKTAYGDRLEQYHPYFWISKIHFYLTDIPSYNFPYTFGYLLSQAICAKIKKDPKWFREQYKDFLLDTGRMTVEELVKKHFGQDVQQELFWQEAIDNALLDIEEFLAL